ncbi:hypothetical protein Pla52n_70630 [Stieleria varia]|uniref:Uncharacterized protein n=1 Tax=Stieleria varia TaxID=2528005 RepID=A0A5C5ZHZ2_9BACT|nr:hypothetical protein Pla52n_70630 [Stieleria varia]
MDRLNTSDICEFSNCSNFKRSGTRRSTRHGPSARRSGRSKGNASTPRSSITSCESKITPLIWGFTRTTTFSVNLKFLGKCTTHKIHGSSEIPRPCGKSTKLALTFECLITSSRTVGRSIELTDTATCLLGVANCFVSARLVKQFKLRQIPIKTKVFLHIKAIFLLKTHRGSTLKLSFH